MASANDSAKATAMPRPQAAGGQGKKRPKPKK